MSVVNLVTIENFESKKIQIRNSCSSFGQLNKPEMWSNSLNIFQFENESVVDLVTTYLTDEYFCQLDEFRKTFLIA